MSRGAKVLTTSVLLRLSPDQRAAWQTQAHAQGKSLSAWLRGLADAASVPVPVKPKTLAEIFAAEAAGG